MRQVVIVAPQFPPSNLTAGHRSRYFAGYLREFGWNPKILTVDPVYYEEKLDMELKDLISADLEVIRTKAIPVKPLRIIGDIGVRAFWQHYRELSSMIKKGGIDLVYIPIPPNYSAMLGPLIYKRYKIPYAIDYIDPWVNTPPVCKTILSKAWLSYRLGAILEPIVLKSARLITAVAPSYYEAALKKYSWLPASRCLAMPYGAEIEEFRYLDKYPRPAYLFNPQDGLMHIVYAGAMLPKAYSTLAALLEAVSILKAKEPVFTKNLRFHFIGTGSKVDDDSSFMVKQQVERYELSDIVLEHPKRIPYLDVLNHLRRAHAVLIMGSSEEHYTPSKIFQAILSRRPVMALIHTRSTAVDILKRSNAGMAITFDDKKTAMECQDEIIDGIRYIAGSGYSPEKVNWKVIEAYSAREMTKNLAGAFDRIIEKAGQ